MSSKMFTVLAVFGLLLAGASAQTPITDILAQEDFSTLSAVVELTGLAPVLTAEDAQLTIFAPTNAAFEDLAEFLGTDVQGLTELPVEDLTTILLYHVVANQTLTVDAIPSGVSPVPTAAEQALLVNKWDDMVYLVDTVGHIANVTSADIEAGPGDLTVHVIDHVVLPDLNLQLPEPVLPEEPSSQTILEVAQSVPELSTLAAILEALNVSIVTEADAAYTIFAPTNDAFTELLSAAGISSLDQVLEDEALVRFVEATIYYHVAIVPLNSTQVLELETIPTLIGAGYSVTVNTTGEMPMIDGLFSSAGLVQTDVQAANSYIHVIDTVLLPVPPPPMSDMDEEDSDSTSRRRSLISRKFQF